MLKYTEELYARFGRKYCPTGKTGADWDALEADNAKARELLGEVLSATVDAGVYPNGPCLQKDLRDEVRHFLANIPQSATPGGQSPAQPYNPSPGVAL